MQLVQLPKHAWKIMYLAQFFASLFKKQCEMQNSEIVWANERIAFLNNQGSENVVIVIHNKFWLFQ